MTSTPKQPTSAPYVPVTDKEKRQAFEVAAKLDVAAELHLDRIVALRKSFETATGKK